MHLFYPHLGGAVLVREQTEARKPVHLCAHRARLIRICVLAKTLRGYAGERLGLWEDVIHAGMDPEVFRVHLLS